MSIYGATCDQYLERFSIQVKEKKKGGSRYAV